MAATASKAERFGTELWQGASLDPARGHMDLPRAVADELSECVDYLRRNPLPVLALRTHDFTQNLELLF